MAVHVERRGVGIVKRGGVVTDKTQSRNIFRGFVNLGAIMPGNVGADGVKILLMLLCIGGDWHTKNDFYSSAGRRHKSGGGVSVVSCGVVKFADAVGDFINVRA
jgi:hypothetical protein